MQGGKALTVLCVEVQAGIDQLLDCSGDRLAFHGRWTGYVWHALCADHAPRDGSRLAQDCGHRGIAAVEPPPPEHVGDQGLVHGGARHVDLRARLEQQFHRRQIPSHRCRV